ncbi:MAG: hypothetical protein EAZ55_11115 [Cytophagales bacterium]|nr:MAG: hypothetical protein EAZ55_11115 [Cytophagales bacterium]
MKKIHLLLFISIILWSSCQPNKTQEKEEKEEKTSESKNTKDSSQKEEKTEKTNQALSLGGIWYIPEMQTALLIVWQKDKIATLMQAKGNAKFSKINLLSQGNGDMGFDFSYSLPSEPKTTYEAVVSFSPMGANLSIRTKGNAQFMGSGTLVIQNDNPSDYTQLTALECMREWFQKAAYIDYSTNHEIRADAQEGTKTNELFLIYKHKEGKEESITATINAKTHELTFNSPSIGRVRMKLNASGFELFDNNNLSKGNFSIKPPQ